MDMAKPMVYKQEDGTRYKISYSEELQIKNLNATKEQTFWLKKNFYIMLLLLFAIVAMIAMIFAVVYWVDAHGIITRMLGAR